MIPKYVALLVGHLAASDQFEMDSLSIGRCREVAIPRACQEPSHCHKCQGGTGPLLASCSNLVALCSQISLAWNHIAQGSAHTALPAGLSVYSMRADVDMADAACCCLVSKTSTKIGKTGIVASAVVLL